MVNAHETLLYGLAAVLYVGLGLLFKGMVLNWVVGPTFPFLVVYALPRWFRRRVRAVAAPVAEQVPG